MRKSTTTNEYRCCYCRTTNEYTFSLQQKKQGLHKKKTLKVPCSTCDDTVLANKRGA